MTLIHAVRARMPAYANWGRWVVSCSRCPAAMALEPGTPMFRCRDCDALVEIVWPPDGMVRGVERLLMMRPDVSTRNWLPHETLVDLMVENGHHGVLDGDGSDSPRLLLSVTEDKIMTDELPAHAPLMAIA